jgi:catechol 2,3-dioxygenase-like lactoylglutathione lyase family enzyme
MSLTVVIDCSDPDAVLEFWVTALGYRVVDVPGQDVYRVLVPAERGTQAPVVALQRVPEPRLGKNRVHLDVHTQDLAGLTARLEALGGRRLGEPVTDLVPVFGTWWQVMADPEGNELCLVVEAATQPPPTASAEHTSA